ncbi:hypothetical protein GQ457_07G000170 [Hibiscus cannabinus]
MVRVPSLVEGLEKAVRQQAKLYTSRRLIKSVSKGADDVEDGFECENIESYQDGNQEKKEGMEVMYPIGGSLVSFNHERHFILLYNDFDPIKVIPKEKDKKYYLPRNLYAVCNFNVALLPIKLNLPMICPPLEWKSVRRSGKKPRNLSELSGGYLSNISGEIYDRYRLLTSENTNHFYIYLGDNYEKLCGVMNKLQGQAFKINSSFLHHLLKNEYFLDLLAHYLESFTFRMRKFTNYVGSTLSTLIKNIQRARFEQFILKVAKAPYGYKLYFPAYLDFRGRIYRTAVASCISTSAIYQEA